MRSRVYFFTIGISLLFFSCASNVTEPVPPKEISMVFGGDIMAHTEITEKNFDSAFDDIEPILRNADFSFANFESPVNDNLPQSSYPTFNCHTDFADRTLRAGFNVISLANNHSNDFHFEGLVSTKKYFDSKKSQGIFSSGIKNAPYDNVSFIEIEKNGMIILFASVTEVLNFKTNTDMFDYVKPEENSRKSFLNLIKQQKKKSKCDLMVISFHTSEEEYVRSIAEKSKNFYYSIIDSGADILWINHPHVSKEWELINTKDGSQKLIFYSVGNTLSAQRRKPNFKKPGHDDEYKGDSFLFTVHARKNSDGITFSGIDPQMITTYINNENNFVVRKLDEDFIDSLEAQGKKDWAVYLRNRMKHMEKIKGIVTWQ